MFLFLYGFAFRLFFKCRVFYCFGWVRWIGKIGGVRVCQSHWAMDSKKFKGVSIVNKSAVQSQSSKVSGSFKFMSEVGWTSSM